MSMDRNDHLYFMLPKLAEASKGGLNCEAKFQTLQQNNLLVKYASITRQFLHNISHSY